MTQYVPILKGKPGEFLAWQNADDQVLASTHPVFEAVPNRGVDVDLAKFVRDAAHWPTSKILTFDTGALDQDPVPGTEHGPLEWLARELHERGIRGKPVVHLDDHEAVVDAAAAAHQLHGQGILVRAGSEELDPDVATCAAELPRVLARTGLGRQDVDLLFDLRFVDDPRTVQRVSPLAVQLVQWAASDGAGWRSVTVASGAFPSSISHLPTGQQTALRRFDADLWGALAGRSMTVNFGDYAVANPTIGVAIPRGPLPNLRYTVGDEWWVWRESRVLPGNESMRTLCARIVDSPAWPGPDYSWGDREIARLARGEGGAGTATQWRAWGSSHHLAVVTDRLATRAAP